MADITMPKLSDTMTEGTLVSWKKKPGDAVSMGEVIAEVETDKATMEMEAFEDGVLSEIFAQEGAKVQVGQRIGRIGGENGNTGAGGGAAATPSAGTQGAAQNTLSEPPSVVEEKRQPEAASAAPNPPQAAPAAKVNHESAERVKASPLARKVAKAENVDLASLKGTGPGNRIIQRDVLEAAKGHGAAPVQPLASSGVSTSPKVSAPVPAFSAAAPAAGDQRIPLSAMRKVIAERLLASKTQIPHFYLRIEVDAAPLVKLRAEVNAAMEKEGVKFSVNDYVLKAAIAAISRVPKVNASFDRDAIIQYASINLAVAVAIEDGLVTPVIRNAQSKSLREISAGVKDLAVRARSKKLKPEEYQGGTFTVSNLGAYGIDNFDAIINPPQAAILSVGALAKKPVVNDHDEIVVGHRLSIGLSCDHRVVDGAIGAEYLSALRSLIECPATMLV